MADTEIVTDRTPLLERKGSAGSIDSNNKLGFSSLEKEDLLIKTDSSKFGISNDIDVSDDPGCMSPYNEESLSEHKQSSDIVCIFTVAFDTRAGNIIEWHLPSDCNVDGIEFKAMASGSHRVHTDFIYFKRGQLYGLACFENMPVDNASERGARMKSVGVLAVTYTSLHFHMSFLKKQVRQQLEDPGSYSEMEAYYEEHKGSFPTFNAFPDHTDILSTKLWNNFMPLMKITHPAGCFSQVLNFFGERIFVLWKLALLKKRIIFFSPPPIGIVCYRVYCTICLAAHRMTEVGQWNAQPFFYVNVADMDTLGSEKIYVACTTEKIFQTKTSLYDLYVDNQNFFSEIPIIQKLMGTSFADKMKYDQLCKLQSLQNRRQNSDVDEEEDKDETWFVRYFMSLNEHLFSTLLSVSRTQQKEWTIEHMHSVGLDPVNDRTFVMELAETYGIDIVPPPDTLCCSP